MLVAAEMLAGACLPPTCMLLLRCFWCVFEKQLPFNRGHSRLMQCIVGDAAPEQCGKWTMCAHGFVMPVGDALVC